MKVIINVDDAGLHPAVNRAVEILADKGLVTAASIVANGDATLEATEIQGIDLGVHLDILRGRPLSHWQGVNSIVDENGSFLINPVQLFQRYTAGKVDHNQVEKEWSAQIERIIDLGIQPTHLTSYKHIHAWPSLTRMASDLAQKYNIPWARKPEDCSEISRLDKSGMNTKFLSVCGFFDRESEDVHWSDVFWSAWEDETKLLPDNFAAALDKCRLKDDNAVIEIGCCPGMTISGDPVIPDYCNPPEISGIWRNEYKYLMEGNWLEYFSKNGLTLSRFSECLP